MTKDSSSSRRSFLKGGAIIAAPLAAIGAPVAAFAADDSREKLARLEDERAIRALHQRWLRHMNGTGADAPADLYAHPHKVFSDSALRAIAPDHAHETPEKIEIAADGTRARACYACTVETGRIIPPDNTLAQMLHAQGEGHVIESDRKLAFIDYVKTDRGWLIGEVQLARV